jgi:threonyl-tRNA synthetase
LNSDPKVLAHVSRVQSVLSGLQPHDALPPTSSTSPRPLPLSTIHLPIDIDTSDRSLGKKVAESRLKMYNHQIVVGGKEAESDTIVLKILNQPNHEATSKFLETALGEPVDEKQLAKRGVAMPLDIARKYFEMLANAFM